MFTVFTHIRSCLSIVDGGIVSLFFSIEYSVDDVKKVLENSIDEVVSRTLLDTCQNDDCESTTYQLFVFVDQRGK